MAITITVSFLASRTLILQFLSSGSLPFVSQYFSTHYLVEKRKTNSCMISSGFPNENGLAIMTIRFWIGSFSWTYLGWTHFLKEKQDDCRDQVFLHGGEAGIFTKAESIRVLSTWWVLKRTPAAWLKWARSRSFRISPSGICAYLALAHMQSEEWRPCKDLHRGKRANRGAFVCTVK